MVGSRSGLTKQPAAAPWRASQRRSRPHLSSPTDAARHQPTPNSSTPCTASVLDRAGDAGGVEFWLDKRQEGTTIPQLLLPFADSPENVEGSGTRP